MEYKILPFLCDDVEVSSGPEEAHRSEAPILELVHAHIQTAYYLHSHPLLQQKHIT